MRYKMITAVGMMAFTLAVGACNRTPVEQRDSATGAKQDANRAAAVQQQHDQDLSKLDDRVAALERNYEDKRAARPSGTSGATTAGNLRNEVKSDLDDVKEAVSRLRTTTPENWWERHEAALRTAVGQVETDVKRVAGGRTAPVRPKEARAEDASGQLVSTEPFTSRRDKFTADMHSRLEAMSKALDGVKATGPRKTEVDDLHARVDKLAGDIKRLESASAEDWWDLSKSRVGDYIDRVERSVGRLDDNKR